VQSPVSPSPEEELSCRVLEGRDSAIGYDALILVVDATQLERHLKFAAYAAGLGKPAVIALTMIDLLAQSGRSISTQKLTEALGIPVVPIDGRTGWGTLELISTLREAANSPAQSETALARSPAEAVEAYTFIRDLINRSGAVRQGKPLTLAPD